MEDEGQHEVVKGWVLRWVKAGSGYGQALLRLLTTESLWCILKA